jgi:uncharacterized membrane protein YgdD (TMEM256/DUF423 family)
METAAPAPTVRSRSTGRYVAASLIGLLALLLGAAGAAGLWARYGASDHGWITSGTHRYAASGRAIVSGSLDADGIPNWLVAKARITASSGNGHALFVGVARRADVDRYLTGVAHSTVEDVNFGPFDATYSSSSGTVAPAPPAAQSFWVKSDSRTATWKIRNGHWRVVVMNADASPGVVADAKVGVTVRGALPIAFSLLGAALVLVAGAVALALGRRRR